jgi:LuxR family transcriptional regulator, maltose regulon positive regulatory protein
LAEDLGPSRAAPVIAVCAPAGYGKTTLVGHWLDHGGVPGVRVSAVQSAGDARSFWGAVSRALVPGAPGDRPAGVADVLDRVRAAAERGPAVLVLEDLHLLDDEALTILDGVLVRLPAPLTVVLTSRRPLERRVLGDLRARGALVDVGPSALRLTDEETRGLLVDVAGVDPGPDGLRAVVDACEGWPAAVAIVARALRRGEDLERVLAVPRAAQDPLAALARTGMDLHGDRERDVVLAISLLDGFTEAIVTAVLGDPSAWGLLRRLDACAEFLVPLDGTGTRWRLHHLVRDGLRDELARRDPARRRHLHERAAAVFEARGDLVAAMDHMHAAHDHRGAARLIGGLYGTLSVPRNAVGLRWATRTPVAVRDRDPVLCAVAGWLWAVEGDRDERDRALDAGRRIAGDGPVAECVSWASAEAVVRSVVSFGDLEVTLAAARDVLRIEPSGSAPAAMTQCTVASLLYLLGDPEGAEEAVRSIPAAAIARAAEHDGPLLTLAPAYLALALFEQGRPDEATPHALRAADARRVSGFRDETASVVAFEALARAQTVEGDPVRGLATAVEGLRRAARGFDGAFVVPRLLGEVARAHRSAGNDADAATALERATDVLVGSTNAGAVPGRLRAIAPAVRGSASDGALSSREREVLAQLAGPHSASEIAVRLFVSPNTVRTHVKAIHRKLGVSSRREAVRKARELGLLDATPWAP